MSNLTGWQEVNSGSDEGLSFRGPTSTMTVQLNDTGERRTILVIVHDISDAKRDGILPERNKGRLIMVNANTVYVVFTIGKTDYRMKAGRGYKNPKQAFNYSVAPASYPVVVKVPGEPQRTERIRIAAGTAWAIIATPTGGYNVVQMY